MASLSPRARRAGFKRKSGRTPTSSLHRKDKTNRTRKKGKRLQVGRPQKWNREKTFTYITGRMEKGDLVTYILKEIHLDRKTIDDWIMADRSGGLGQRWQAAKVAQSRAIADRTMRLASGKDGREKAIKRHKKKLKDSKDPRLGELVRQLDNTRIQRNKLEVETSKWFVKVTNPREFGDKVDVTSDGEKLPQAQALTVNFVAAKGGAK